MVSVCVSICPFVCPGTSCYLPHPPTGGNLNYWSSLPGAPEIRTKCIHTFAQHGGFDDLTKVLRTKNIGWLGAEDAKILLQAAVDARGATRVDGMVLDICAHIMEPLSTLTEEELKVSHTTSLLTPWILLLLLYAPYANPPCIDCIFASRRSPLSTCHT